MPAFKPQSSLTRAVANLRSSARPAQPGMTAASSDLQVPFAPSAARSEAMRSRHEKWQYQILSYAQSVPEVGGAAMRVNDAASRVKWVVSGGTAQEQLIGQSLVDSLDKPRAIRLLFLSGEVYLCLAAADDPERNLRAGEMYTLSIDELNTTRSPAERRTASGSWVPMTDTFVRVWYESDTNRWVATSPNQAAMDLIEAMYLHQLADAGVAQSRMIGAGILVWPTTLPNNPTLVDGKPAPGSQQEMIQKLGAAMRRAVEPRNRMEAAMPFVQAVDAELHDGARPSLLRLDKDDRAGEYAQRYDAYSKRYYETIQMPIESMQGMSGANAIAGHGIREDMVREYLTPMMEPVRHALERRVLALISPDLRLSMDFSDLIMKPDQTATIMELLSIDVVTPDSAKAAILAQDLSLLQMVSPPARTYNSNVLRSTPSDMKPGGDRGGGQFRNRA